ncbi:MAG TPA: YbaB/EbfC family nucleoid-associated protein [Planctomycetes bacterium]|nr:YbaB/EbfC family nucleoid-associated protein [Planctomycetota bacterium]HIK59237.1 YbaB/EbfC family nucleoid-associated protein [Planctomycetota bacterium]
MSGSFGDMGNLLKQAQRMQAAMKEAREELDELELVGSSGGGVVGVTVSANGEVKSVRISEEAMKSEDCGLLQDLVLAAVQDALSQAKRTREERLAKVTGGLNLPGFQ